MNLLSRYDNPFCYLRGRCWRIGRVACFGIEEQTQGGKGCGTDQNRGQYADILRRRLSAGCRSFVLLGGHRELASLLSAITIESIMALNTC